MCWFAFLANGQGRAGQGRAGQGRERTFRPHLARAIENAHGTLPCREARASRARRCLPPAAANATHRVVATCCGVRFQRAWGRLRRRCAGLACSLLELRSARQTGNVVARRPLQRRPLQRCPLQRHLLQCRPFATPSVCTLRVLCCNGGVACERLAAGVHAYDGLLPHSGERQLAEMELSQG